VRAPADTFGPIVPSLPAQPAAAPIAADETALLRSLRSGDERAFEEVVARYHATMVAVARNYVKTAALAEDVVQEAWLGVLNGLGRFEGRSSLRTWILRIVVNTAISRATREARSVPFSSLVPDDDEGEPAVDPSRFLPPDHPRWPGHWSAPPQAWAEQSLLDKEAVEVVRGAIETLPAKQRDVITLRDVEGWASDEVCETLQISEANQRVLLHRARSKVRAALEQHFGAEGGR
jgi:RNA polymerase sigma-70 factor, ECF subfamily